MESYQVCLLYRDSAKLTLYQFQISCAFLLEIVDLPSHPNTWTDFLACQDSFFLLRIAESLQSLIHFYILQEVLSAPHLLLHLSNSRLMKVICSMSHCLSLSQC